MVESTVIVHVNFMVIFQVSYQIRKVTNDSAFGTSIGAVIESKDTEIHALACCNKDIC